MAVNQEQILLIAASLADTLESLEGEVGAVGICYEYVENGKSGVFWRTNMVEGWLQGALFRAAERGVWMGHRPAEDEELD